MSELEPKTEREFFLLLVEQVKQIRIDIDEVKKSVLSKVDILIVADMEKRLDQIAEWIETLKISLEVQSAKEQAIIEAEEKEKQRIKEEYEKRMSELDIKNKKAKRIQIVAAIISSAILTGVIIYYYLSQ